MRSDEGVSGVCLCSAVGFEIRFPSQACVHCHCSMCRRNHGAGYVTWLVVPRAQVEVVRGADEIVRYQSSEHGSRSFCARCGSTLFCENDAHPDQVDIALGSLDGSADRAPQAHVFFDSRADWVEIADPLPRLGGKTGVERLK